MVWGRFILYDVVGMLLLLCERVSGFLVISVNLGIFLGVGLRDKGERRVVGGVRKVLRCGLGVFLVVFFRGRFVGFWFWEIEERINLRSFFMLENKIVN